MTHPYDFFNQTKIQDLNTLANDADKTSLDKVTQQRLKKQFLLSLENRADQSPSLKTPTDSSVKRHRFNYSKKWSMTAVILILLILAGFTSYKISPSFAMSIPVVGHMIRDITGYGNTDFDAYTKVIGTEVTYGDLSITLNEVLLDDNQLRFAYTFKSHEYPINDYHFTHADYTFNGKNINLSGATGTGETLDDYTMIWISTLDVHQLHLPSRFNLAIEFNTISRLSDGGNQIPLGGQWFFKTRVNKAEIESQSHHYKIHEEVSIDNTTLSLEKLILTPISGTLDYKLYGSDEPFQFIIMDNTGHEMRISSSGYGTPKGFMGAIWGEFLNYRSGDIHFSPVSEEATSITLTPYVQSYALSGKEERNYTIPVKLKNHEPLTLIQNENNKILVTDYLIKDHQLHVKFKCQGQSPATQAYKLYAYDPNGNQLQRNYQESQIAEISQDTIQTAIFDLNDDFDDNLEELPIERTGLSLGTDDMSDMTFYPDKTVTIDIIPRTPSH